MVTSIAMWLIPIEASPTALNATAEALLARGIEFQVVSAQTLRESLAEHAPPAAVIHGGRMNVMVVEAQRWLRDFLVPTTILLEHLHDDHETLLLDRGAQDVVKVPTSSTRLGSRVAALHRTSAVGSTSDAPEEDVLQVGSVLRIYPHRRVVLASNEPVQLAKTEFELLLALARRPGKVLTREDLSQTLAEAHISNRALESRVSRLRVKLRAVGVQKVIESVRGVGYRLGDFSTPGAREDLVDRPTEDRA